LNAREGQGKDPEQVGMSSRKEHLGEGGVEPFPAGPESSIDDAEGEDSRHI